MKQLKTYQEYMGMSAKSLRKIIAHLSEHRQTISDADNRLAFLAQELAIAELREK